MTQVFIAGHRGMVGSAICRNLTRRKVGILTTTRAELDLTSQSDVDSFFQKNDIDQVYLAAAKVGGIHANAIYPADFIYENLVIQTNIIHSAYRNGVKKLLFLGSSCIYPREAQQPIRESALLSGALERSNEPYAIGKIAGIKMCESYNRQYGVDYRSLMPTNLYGENDNFHPENSHVIPALMRRLHEGAVNGDTEVRVWGSGKVRREFLHVDDMAEASVHLMNIDVETYQAMTEPMLSHINVGAGQDLTIKELALMIAKVVGYQGEIKFDPTKPEGTVQKLMDVSKARNLGWRPKIDLEQGLQKTFQWYLANQDGLRR